MLGLPGGEKKGGGEMNGKPITEVKFQFKNITGFSRRMPLVERAVPTLPEHLSSPPDVVLPNL
jgi:hypothetical protein